MIDILIYAAIAGFLAWRLYSVLGTRHEGEPQRPNPFAPPPGNSINLEKHDEMIALPLTSTTLPPPKALPSLNEPPPQSLSGALYAIQKAEPSFDEKTFLKGARVAFEVIVHAYAAPEVEALRPLVSPVLFEAFSGAIATREKAGEKLELKLLNVIESHVSAARIEGHYAYIAVEFISDQARVILANGVVKEDKGPERLTDLWTFRRPLASPDPNWMLVETKSH